MASSPTSPPAMLASSLLRTEGWYRSHRLALLDFDVAVHSDDSALIELVDELYSPLQRSGDAEHALLIGQSGPADRPSFFVALDGEVIVRSPASTVAFSHLIFVANQQAIERTTRLVKLHAAGAVFNDQAIVLPGPMGTGKSTLVAGLVQRGLGYITDEVVAIDPNGARVRPYPRPVSLGTPPASLGPIHWEPPVGSRRYLGASGVVPARALGTPVEVEVPVGLVVLPQYVASAPTHIAAITGADALASIAGHAFQVSRPGTLRAVQQVLDGVPCFELVSGDLTEAVDAVLDVARPLVRAS